MTWQAAEVTNRHTWLRYFKIWSLWLDKVIPSQRISALSRMARLAAYFLGQSLEGHKYLLSVKDFFAMQMDFELYLNGPDKKSTCFGHKLSQLKWELARMNNIIRLVVRFGRHTSNRDERNFHRAHWEWVQQIRNSVYPFWLWWWWGSKYLRKILTSFSKEGFQI